MPPAKDDNLNSDRRLSMGTSLKNQPQKGSSLAKNGLSSNSNRQIPSTNSTKGLDLKAKNIGAKK